MEEVDRNEIIRAGRDKEEAVGLRQRRGKAAEQNLTPSTVIPQDLRELLLRPSLPLLVRPVAHYGQAISGYSSRSDLHKPAESDATALDEAAMRYAIDLSKSCPVAQGAFCVGSVILLPRSSERYTDLEPHFPVLQVAEDHATHGDSTEGRQPSRGVVLATGYSRELEGNTHAEANALSKLQQVL